MADPSWTLDFFHRIEQVVDNISSQTPNQMTEFCEWEFGHIKSQDRADGRFERNYQSDLELWESVRWSSIYNDSTQEYNPRIAVL